MPLKKIGANPPITGPQKSHLLALRRSSSKRHLATPLLLPTRSLPRADALSFTKEASALATSALGSNQPAHAVILFAVAGDLEAAEAAHSKAITHDGADYTVRATADFAVGQYTPHFLEEKSARLGSFTMLNGLRPLVRFPTTASRLDVEAILTALPALFPDTRHAVTARDSFWKPAIGALAALAEENDKAADKIIAAALKRMSPPGGTADFPETYDGKQGALELLWQIAFSRARGLAAARVAKKMRSRVQEKFILRTAVLYASEKDFGGVYELLKKIGRGGSPSKFDSVIDRLKQSGLEDAATA